MKALIVESPKKVTFSTSYHAQSLSDGEICVKVAASPIQPSDILNVIGDFPGTKFPIVPGRDFSGTVVEPKSSPLHGKAVFGTSGPVLGYTKDGAHAEFIIVREDAVAEVPKGVEVKQACLLLVPWTTAFIALTRAGAKKGESILVLGAGGNVGDAAVQLSRSSLWGLKVLTAGRGDKYDVDMTKRPNLENLKDQTDGKGPDIILDTTGNLQVPLAGLTQLNEDGRLVIISVAGGESTGNIDFKEFYRHQRRIIGCNSVMHSQEETAGYLRLMKGPLESGELKAPSLSKWTQIKLDEAATEVYKELIEGSRKKIVLVNDG